MCNIFPLTCRIHLWQEEVCYNFSIEFFKVCICIICDFLGDHDAILTLLMLPRLLWKSEILLSQTRDKFPPIDKIDREGLIRGHTIGQFTFRSRLAFFLHTLQVSF